MKTKSPETVNPVRIPIRRKILFFLLLAITTVAGTITFTMANFFQQDKQDYINDWISIAAVSTAEEARTTLTGYRQRLQLYADIMLNQELTNSGKLALLQGFFDELPELVQVTLYADGEVIENAEDSATLEDAGLTAEALEGFREAHPLPLEAIAAGEVYLRNSSVSEGLPCYTLAVPVGASDGAEPPGPDDGAPRFVVAGVFRADSLLRLGAKFKVFEVLIADGEGTLLAHPDTGRVTAREPAELVADAVGLRDKNQAGRTIEFVQDGVEMLGGYAAVDIAGLAVAVHLPRSAAFLASQALLQRLLQVALVLLVIVALCALLWAHRITRPVERLSNATREIAKGDFNIQVEVHSRDEIGALAGSFNTMTSELKNREAALEEAQGKLIQSEKMSAFGQLGAGIAHEVKNPLAGILGCAQLSLMDVEEGTMVHQNLTLIEKETERCKTIIENLLKFARQEKAHLELTEINPIVHDAAAIVRHQMEIKQVKLEMDLDETIPQIHANSNQMQQVLINLFINAQQAMEGKPGTVTVSTRMAEDGMLEIRVSDTGPGMTDEVQRKLFEPFFTTKPTGKGTGLGLSVTFGIVKDHNGEISVISELGHGAEFVIRMPVMQMIAVPHAELAAEAVLQR